MEREELHLSAAALQPAALIRVETEVTPLHLLTFLQPAALLVRLLEMGLTAAPDSTLITQAAAAGSAARVDQPAG